MPSQSRSFEASFESSDKQQAGRGSDPARMLEDFDTFFEKINGLEQADWRNAHPANPQRPVANTAAQTAAPPSAQPAGRKAPGKIDPLAGLRAAVAQAKQRGPETPARPARWRVAGSFRFAALALLLFVVGMGLGWAALSLPGKGGSDASTTALTAAPEQGPIPDAKGDMGTKGTGDSAAPLAEAGANTGAAAAKEVLLSEMPGQANGRMAAGTPAPQGKDEARGAELAAGANASGKQTGGSSADGQMAKVAHSTKTVQGAKALPAKAVQPAQPLRQSAPQYAAAQNAPGAVQAAAGGARYAVQVGACRSPRCVEGYRQLVTAHAQAGSDAIHIVTVPAEGKDAGMQRVRVAPLDKAAAQRLKDTLVLADARLRGAYVVELRRQ